MLQQVPPFFRFLECFVLAGVDWYIVDRCDVDFFGSCAELLKGFIAVGVLWRTENGFI
jgi:hypothetical protein